MNPNKLAFLSVFLPFFNAVIVGTVGFFLPKKVASWGASAIMVIATLCSWWLGYLFYVGQIIELSIPLYKWMELEALDLNFLLFFDMLSVILLIVVNTISSLVHIYSIEYMERDDRQPKFMCYLSLFTFFMLFLITSSNFSQLFIGWEGVGLCSYLLIGYWYYKPTASAASMKAFIVNRVSDLGLFLGIAACFSVFETLDYKAIFSAVPFMTSATSSFWGYEISNLTLISFLLFIAAMGKSAQFGFHIWLPDAMEGPTPASALIHAATMVTAGVFLLVRLSPLYEASPSILSVIAIIGLLTSIFAATVAATQNDIKRVIAYSTCSQLGYMFFAIGVTGYGIAIFHLVTHAFFKSLLFLGAGSIIHAMSDEQNMNQMGGLYKYIPITYCLMWIASLALMGIPFFSGYYSKDVILEFSMASGTILGKWLYYGGIFAAFLTSLYAVRVMMLTFHGKIKAHDDVIAHVHESSFIMLMPMIILAVGSVFSGGIFYANFVENLGSFWNNSILWLGQVSLMNTVHQLPKFYVFTPVGMAFAGGVIGIILFGSKIISSRKYSFFFPNVYKFFYHRWYVDEIYDFLLCKPYLKFSTILWKYCDKGFIDALGPNSLSYLTVKLGIILGKIQTGYVYHYLLGIILGTVLTIAYFFLL